MADQTHQSHPGAAPAQPSKARQALETAKTNYHNELKTFAAAKTKLQQVRGVYKDLNATHREAIKAEKERERAAKKDAKEKERAQKKAEREKARAEKEAAKTSAASGNAA